MPEQNKLFVRNLPQSLNEDDFKTLFAHFGDIASLKLCHKNEAKTKYGFVTYRKKETALEAKKQLNKKAVSGHSISIEFARSSNDLIIKSVKKSKQHKSQHTVNQRKRKFQSDDNAEKDATTKRRKISENAGNTETDEHEKHENSQKQEQKQKQKEKKIPPSRIAIIRNISKTTPRSQFQQQLFELIDGKHIQYLIYPSKDSANTNTAWLLHGKVEHAQSTVDQLQDSVFDASFARKLNKIYRVSVKNLSAEQHPSEQIKVFLNKHFNKHYKFDEEEKRKFAKVHKYAHIKKQRKHSDKTYDVIQNIHINKKSDSIVVEFKKADYALFAVQHMNGTQFDDNSLQFHFELESEPKTKSKRNDKAQNEQAPKPDNKKEQDVAMHGDGDGDGEGDEDDGDGSIILKMFNIAQSVKKEQLKELMLSMIAKVNGADSMIINAEEILDDIIYPAPDSLPNSQTAWICLKKSPEFDRESAQKIIHQLNDKEINNEVVGIIFGDKSYIRAHTIMVRNLPDSIGKKEIRRIFGKFGSIQHISMKPKANSNFQHSGWCFITFSEIVSASKAIESMNHSKLNNKTIACDYTLPKNMYTKIQNKWKQYHQQQQSQNSVDEKQTDNADESGNKKSESKTEMVPFWKQCSFMQDYEDKSFYQRFVVKSAENLKFIKKNKHKECLEIPISSEPADYDWLKWFLIKHKLHIIQYETNCKIRVHLTEKRHNVEILSDNKHDLQKGVDIVHAMLNNKLIREVGYTQILNIPFELEHKDFDWILYLNGEHYENRKKFELNTGCSFMFIGKLSSYLLNKKSDLLQIKLTAPTKKTLQRGVEYMKKEFLSTEIKHQRESQMEYRFIKRLYFHKASKQQQKRDANKEENEDGKKKYKGKAAAEEAEKIDYVLLIRSPNGKRLKRMEKATNCKIRVFGSNFVNRTNNKSYCKVMAKNAEDLKNGVKLIHDLLFDPQVREKAIAEDYQLLNDAKLKSKADSLSGHGQEKKFWFYSGDANEGRTVFVRNLPFDATDMAIRYKFAPFGNIISVKLVHDKITGNLRGSCFVQFDGKAAVEEILDHHSKEPITLNGRSLAIDVAVNKFEARKLNASKKEDKRNLYLAKVGVMLDEEEMKGMNKVELDRRIEAWKEKKAKLENPNYHVSKTRLCVRNIPKFVKRDQFRHMFHATAARLRNKLTAKPGQNEDVFQFKFPKIVQAKIVSKQRFGFVEFREHSDALLVLRELNNKYNVDVFRNDNSNSNSNQDVEDEDQMKEEEEQQQNAEEEKVQDVPEVSEGEVVMDKKERKDREKHGKLQIEFALENMKKINARELKQKQNQEKWRNVSLEKLKDELQILKAQNQKTEIKVVESKIGKIEQDILKEKLLKQQKIKKMTAKNMQKQKYRNIKNGQNNKRK